jgi:hypothetical protein
MMHTIAAILRYRREQRGQSTVEFALAFIFVAMGVFGVIDVAHAVYEQHGLGRAAEVVAHDLSVTAGALNTTVAATDIGDAHIKSQVDFDLSTPSTSSLVKNGVLQNNDCIAYTGSGSSPSPCQKMSNGDVAIIGIPSLCNGATSDSDLTNCGSLEPNNYTSQVQVTITIKNFGPHTTYFNSFPVNTVTATSTSETNAYLEGINP